MVTVPKHLWNCQVKPLLTVRDESQRAGSGNSILQLQQEPHPAVIVLLLDNSKSHRKGGIITIHPSSSKEAELIGGLKRDFVKEDEGAAAMFKAMKRGMEGDKETTKLGVDKRG
jgi:hypothetical protein